MLKVFEIADELVDQIHAFAPQVDKRTVKAERGYHFVDGTTVPKSELSVVVYPGQWRKEKQGRATRQKYVSLFIVFKASVAPKNKSRIDTLIEYVAEIDTHLEGKPQCGATYVTNEDEQSFWVPDQLHAQNHFSALIELEYKYTAAVGGNPS